MYVGNTTPTAIFICCSLTKISIKSSSIDLITKSMGSTHSQIVVAGAFKDFPPWMKNLTH